MKEMHLVGWDNHKDVCTCFYRPKHIGTDNHTFCQRSQETYCLNAMYNLVIIAFDRNQKNLAFKPMPPRKTNSIGEKEKGLKSNFKFTQELLFTRSNCSNQFLSLSMRTARGMFFAPQQSKLLRKRCRRGKELVFYQTCNQKWYKITNTT